MKKLLFALPMMALALVGCEGFSATKDTIVNDIATAPEPVSNAFKLIIDFILGLFGTLIHGFADKLFPF